MDYKEAVTYNLRGYYKIVDVIDSCETVEHMYCCSNLVKAYGGKMDHNIKRLWKEFFKFPTYKKIKNIFKYKNHCNLVANNLITLVNEKMQLFQNSEDENNQTFPKIKGFAGDE